MRKTSYLLLLACFLFATACAAEREKVEREGFTRFLSMILLADALASGSSGTAATPAITITNASGTSETYAFYDSSDCTGTVVYAHPVAVANGESTGTISGLAVTSYSLTLSGGCIVVVLSADAYECNSDGTQLSCTVAEIMIIFD